MFAWFVVGYVGRFVLLVCLCGFCLDFTFFVGCVCWYLFCLMFGCFCLPSAFVCLLLIVVWLQCRYCLLLLYLCWRLYCVVVLLLVLLVVNLCVVIIICWLVMVWCIWIVWWFSGMFAFMCWFVRMCSLGARFSECLCGRLFGWIWFVVCVFGCLLVVSLLVFGCLFCYWFYLFCGFFVVLC